MKLKGKITLGKFTKEDARKAARKAGREMDLEYSAGWVSTHKAHKSLKDYTRKPKHKKDYSFE
jgi:phosphoribosylcarboxyaminoimidazole (NCAIR) mutase